MTLQKKKSPAKAPAKVQKKEVKPFFKKKKKAPTMRGTNKTTFEIGDRVVNPNYGVGVIERIENKEISGSILSFYIMRILDTEMTVMIPKNSISGAGLREIISHHQVSKVFKIFEDQEVVIDTTTWNRRYREYLEKIKTGSVYEIAQVMRDLYVLKKTKTLSFGERQMLDKARSRLVKELAIAKSVTEEEIEKKIASYFEAAPQPIVAAVPLV